MPEKIEEIMRKIHIYLANCKESAYSSNDVIISKPRLLKLLDELNDAVYEVCEQYEATQESKAAALNAAERAASEIKEDAMNRAEDVYAASLIYMDDAIISIRNSLEYSYLKVRKEYENLISNYEEKMNDLQSNHDELKVSLQSMSESQMYLRIIEGIKSKKKTAEELKAEAVEARKEEIRSTFVGDVTSYETLGTTEEGENASAPADPGMTIEVHDTPKMADISTKGKKKKESFLKRLQNFVSKEDDGDDGETIEVDEKAIDENYGE